MAPYLSKLQRVGLALALISVFDDVRPVKRRWSNKCLRDRRKWNKITLLKHLHSDDFIITLRMDEESFEELLELVRPFITKQDTIMRQAVPAEQRLLATLRFLATGLSYKELSEHTGISLQLLSRIIPETCGAIYKVLKKGISMPSTEEEWLAVANLFEEKWQFNNCVGAMSAKHIIIEKPSKSGTSYNNYCGTCSVILFAIVNADYDFIYVHMGTSGSTPTEEIVKNTRFYDKLIDNELHLPESYLLPNTNQRVPYVFLDDNTLPVDTHIMNPYIEDNLLREEEIFNYRFWRAQRTVENALGVLGSRFGIFRQPISVSMPTLESVIMACCALHNFFKEKSRIYWSPTCVDDEDVLNLTFTQGEWRNSGELTPLETINEQKQTDDGYRVRHVLKEYFSCAGSVSFQNVMVDVVY